MTDIDDKTVLTGFIVCLVVFAGVLLLVHLGFGWTGWRYWLMALPALVISIVSGYIVATVGGRHDRYP